MPPFSYYLSSFSVSPSNSFSLPVSLPPSSLNIQYLFQPLHMKELQLRRDVELNALQEQLADLNSQLETMEMNMRKFTTGVHQMAELQEQRNRVNKDEAEAYKLKKHTYDLLPNADENISKLQVCVWVCLRGVPVCLHV